MVVSVDIIGGGMVEEEYRRETHVEDIERIKIALAEFFRNLVIGIWDDDECLQCG